jgi:hypothetical protein
MTIDDQVWVPTIDNGTNEYTMTLRQPEGLPFMVTVWGKSGIQFAGTTDIYSKSDFYTAAVSEIGI